MIRIRLGDDDRERLGITQEWLEFDVKRLMAREAALLHRKSGFDPESLLAGLAGKQKVDRDTGEKLTREVVDPDTGEVKVEPVIVVDMDAVIALGWMAAVRAGFAIPYEKFDFDLFSYAMEDVDDEPEVEAEGEADARATPDSAG